MNKIVKIFVLMLVTGSVAAQSGKTELDQFTLEKIITGYALSSGEKVLVDPRVKGRVKLHGQSPENLSYDKLTTILGIHGFASYRSGGFLVIIPINIMKQQPIGLVQEDQQYVSNEIVNDLIEMEKLCPYELVPLLRPLVPPSAHFGLLLEPRVLYITGTYANIQRIREVVQRLDSQLTRKQACPEPGDNK